MRTLLFGLAVAFALVVYEWYSHRPSEEGPHDAGGPGGGHRPRFSDDEYIEAGPSSNESEQSARRRRTKPPIGEVCAICLEQLIRNDEARKYCITQLPCNHWFHQKCALRLLEYHPECPICRTKIDESQLRAAPVNVGEPGPQ